MLWLFSLLFAVHGFGAECQPDFARVFHREISLADLQKAWAPSEFSDPTRHDPKKFRYIVHAGPHVTEGGGNAMAKFLAFMEKHDFNTENLFSASVVDEKHTATFNTFGVLLDTPPEKIIAATSEDMRSLAGSIREEALPEKIKGFVKTEGLAPPQQVLDKSASDTGFYRFDLSWTEVLLFGKGKSDSRIIVNGLFTHEDSLGAVMLDGPGQQLLKSTAAKMKVPVVTFPPPPGHYVLKVRMKGARKPTEHLKYFMSDFGPQSIEFLGEEAAVRKLFQQAAKEGRPIRLVDESQGPIPLFMDEEMLGGAWKNLDKKGVLGEPLNLKREELPAGVEPIEFKFPGSP